MTEPGVEEWPAALTKPRAGCVTCGAQDPAQNPQVSVPPGVLVPPATLLPAPRSLSASPRPPWPSRDPGTLSEPRNSGLCSQVSRLGPHLIYWQILLSPFKVFPELAPGTFSSHAALGSLLEGGARQLAQWLWVELRCITDLGAHFPRL